MSGASTITKNAPGTCANRSEGTTATHTTEKEVPDMLAHTTDNAQVPEQGTGVYFDLMTYRDEVDNNKIVAFEFRHHEIHADISVGVYGFPGIRTWTNAFDISDVDLDHVETGELIDAIKRARKLCRVLNADPEFAGTLIFDVAQQDAARRAVLAEGMSR